MFAASYKLANLRVAQEIEDNVEGIGARHKIRAIVIL